jgi:acetyl esterase/lipase
MKNAFVAVVALLYATLAHSQPPTANWKDVNYAGDGKPYHNMDIYLPQTNKASYPVVVYIYGSAWFSNSSKGADINTVGKALLDAGFAVVMPNHRSSRDTLFPGPVHDIKAAIRFIRGNAAQYKFDTSFIGVSGSSSGGNMAAMAGTSSNAKTQTVGGVSMDITGSVGAFGQYSSAVDAVVDWFGPTNMLVMDSCGGTDFTHNDAQSPASIYIGGAIQQNKERTLLASPITYIDASDPPFLIFHGDKDNVVPYCQSVLLNTALQKGGVPTKYIQVPGGGHGPGVHVPENLKKMADFFAGEARKKAVKK